METYAGQFESTSRIKFRRRAALAYFLVIPTLFLRQVIWAEDAGRSKYFHVEGQSRWKEIPREALTAHSDKVRQQTGLADGYLAGYTMTPGKKQLEFPVILVTSTEKGKFPEKELAGLTQGLGPAELEERLKTARSKSKLTNLPPMKANSMSYEAARRIMWFKAVTHSPQQGEVHVITAMMLIETGTLNFALYTLPDDGGVRLGEFNEFLSHVKVAPGFIYRPEADLGDEMVKAAGRGLSKGIVFGGIGFCFTLLLIAYSALTRKVSSKNG